MPRNVCVRIYQDFPARFVFVILGFIGILNIYAMRVNLSVAMVAMINKTQQQNGQHEDLVCKNLVSYGPNQTQEVEGIPGEFNWNLKTQSLILGSFFYGYVFTQIPGGMVADKFGGKWPMACGMVITSIFTLLTPLAARSGVTVIVISRIIDGLGEGVAFPAIYSLVGRWIPKMERSRTCTIIYMGIPVGTILGMFLTGVLCSSVTLGGWPSTFYVFGVLSLIGVISWIIFAYNSPSMHPKISKKELDLILRERELEIGIMSVPWKSILKSCPVWALTITHIGHNWGFLTLLIEMPTYLSNVLHFNQMKNGALSALPYVLQAIVSLLASFAADKLRISGKFKITTIRKFFNSIEFYGAGVCLLAAAFVGCNPIVIVTLFTLAMGSIGCMNAGFNVTHVDMSPQFAGTLMAFTNSISNVTGFLAPAYASWIVQDKQTVESWGTVFITASCVYFFTGTVYNVFCSAELQSWGLPSNDVDPIHGNEDS